MHGHQKTLDKQRFGKLVATDEKIKKGKVSYYKCLCDCGLECYTRRDHLITGKTKSCGCLISEKNRQHGLDRVVWSDFFPDWILTTYVSRAKRKSLVFNLTIEDLDSILMSQDYKCFYTNDILIPPVKNSIAKISRVGTNISIDRLDNSVGYTKDNVCLCVKQANMSKYKYSVDEFVKLSIKIANNPRFKQQVQELQASEPH